MNKTSPFIFLAFFLLGFVNPKSDFVLNQNKKVNHVTKTVLSDVYHIDTIYKSMMGPMSSKKIKLGSTYSTQLMWITGFEAMVVDAKGTEILPNDYVCHSNLNLDFALLNNTFRMSHRSDRAFTLSQGQLKVNFPEGFAIPTLGMYPFLLSTQALNLNNHDLDIEVRHKIKIDYVIDSFLENAFTPLMVTSAYGVKALKKGQQHYDVQSTDHATYGQSCLVGTAARPRDITDKYGQKFTGHWIVPPGREVNYTNVTRMMNIPFNTTIHYISVHAHPFAESLELKDLTTGESLFKSEVLNSKNKIGIDQAAIFSSVEGIPVYKDHEYQLISIYNNTSDTDQDAMAVMYLYLKDVNYKYGR